MRQYRYGEITTFDLAWEGGVMSSVPDHYGQWMIPTAGGKIYGGGECSREGEESDGVA